MYIDQKYFDSWMNRLTNQIEHLHRKIDRQDNSITPKIDDEILLDNQDLCLLLKVSTRTLQRFRTSGRLPYRLIGRKVYYLESDVTDFIHRGCKTSNCIVQQE